MGLVRLPLYRCHKQVRAAKIVGIEPCDTELNTTLLLSIPGDTETVKARVDASWKVRNPATAIGGYFVEYQEGDKYTAYSPAAPFECGYTLLEP